MANKFDHGDEIKEALKQCPDWLKQRIALQSRNLMFIHRIQGARVSAKTCQTLLNTMGLLIAKVLFDKAAADAEAFINNLGQPAPAEIVAPALEIAVEPKKCAQCGTADEYACHGESADTCTDCMHDNAQKIRDAAGPSVPGVGCGGV